MVRIGAVALDPTKAIRFGPTGTGVHSRPVPGVNAVAPGRPIETRNKCRR